MENPSSEITEFLSKTNLIGYDFSPLVGDASDRKYYRLRKDGGSLILMDASKSIDTMKIFLSVREYLSDNKFSVPQIFSVDLNGGYMVLEDFGEHTVDKYLLENHNDQEKLYDTAVDLVSSLSALTSPPFPEFDRQYFLHELSVFTTWYMSYIGESLGDEELAEFNACWNKSLKYLSLNDGSRVFIHKDLHCGNLFWLPARSGVRKLGVIDFQSAKSGSGVYDITSLLYDCRFPLQQGLRSNLLKKYLTTKSWRSENFKNLCDIYIAQRNIKILGNFAQIYQQKENSTYLKFLPNVWKFIQDSLDNPILEDVKAWFIRNNIRLIERFP